MNTATRLATPVLLILVVTASLSAGGPDKALVEVRVTNELRQAELEGLHIEVKGLSDPGLAAVQAVLLITEWGIQADDPQPAFSALERVASAAEGTPLRRLALFHLARLLGEKERQEEAVQMLATLAVEAAEEARHATALKKEVQRLRHWEAQLAARAKQLEEQAQRLKEYAGQLKAEQARLQHGERGQAQHDAGPERGREAGKGQGGGR